MNFIKEYIYPALILILVGGLIIIAGQLITQTPLAAGIRAATANQPSEVATGPTDIISFFSGLGVSLVKQTLLIVLPAIVTWNILKRTNE